MSLTLAAASTTERLTTLLAQLSGLAILGGLVSIVAAFAYRWYVREPIPRGLAILLGLSAVAAVLNTTTVLGEVLLDGSSDATRTAEAFFNIAAFGAGFAGATVGRRLGDGFGTDIFDVTTFAEVDDGVGRLVKAVGRVVTVDLPEDIDDVVGYDPVPETTKAELAGKTFVFPRNLTVDQLRDRLVSRLKTDFAVGHVDVELDDDGTITYLAFGSRAAGIGPTLPPATNALAIRADPAFAASAGDLVQVWETDPARRVLTAELRGVADDVVTVAIDAADTSKLDPTTEYRLVTLPVEDRPDRAFASLLRAADESFASATVVAGSALDGIAVGGVEVTVLSVVPAGEDPVVLPTADHVLGAGDVVHAIARPEALRRFESAATTPIVDDAAGAATDPQSEPSVEPSSEPSPDDSEPADDDGGGAEAEPSGDSAGDEALDQAGTGDEDESAVPDDEQSAGEPPTDGEPPVDDGRTDRDDERDPQ